MKTPLFAAVLLLAIAPAAFAQPSFPGLKAVLSEAEWKRAGLDRLSPDELGVIDAALIRREAGVTARHQTEISSVRASAAAAPAAAASATFGAAPKPAEGWLQRFGLPFADRDDWRSLPSLKAKVVKWETANRFVLDNGQAWEGFETISYELVGKDIEIQARPHEQFALSVSGVNTTIRVMRIR